MDNEKILCEKIVEEGFAFIKRTRRKDIPSTLKDILKNDPRKDTIQQIRIVKGSAEVVPEGYNQEIRFSSNHDSNPDYGIYIKYE